MSANEVPERYRVRLQQFTEHDLNNSFVAYNGQYGIVHVYSLDGGWFAVEIASVGPDLSETSNRRYLTQAEVDSFHFEVRASDGIKELSVTLT